LGEARALLEGKSHVLHAAEAGERDDRLERQIGLAQEALGTRETALHDLIEHTATGDFPEAAFQRAPGHADVLSHV